jgi:hypothetical protein
VNLHQHLHAAAKAGRAVPEAYTALAKRDERFNVTLVATNGALGRMSGEAAEGNIGLESIVHEASRTMDASIMRAVNAEGAAQNVRAPRNLWHALMFYTTGELVRRELGKTGDAHYLPYAYRFDVDPKGMDKDRAALERAWQPFLDGKVTYEEGLRNLVRAATR